MSKVKAKAPTSNEDFESALKSEVAVFDVPTIGMIKTATGYTIVKVMIDGKGLTAGEVTVIDTAESKAEANEKFKIYIVKNGIL